MGGNTQILRASKSTFLARGRQKTEGVHLPTSSYANFGQYPLAPAHKSQSGQTIEMFVEGIDAVLLRIPAAVNLTPLCGSHAPREEWRRHFGPCVLKAPGDLSAPVHCQLPSS